MKMAVRASLSNSDNYRGISMFNSIHKLFDYVIIDICSDSLLTSDMQYGYKNNHSTTMCTVILNKVIHHYINGNNRRLKIPHLAKVECGFRTTPEECLYDSGPIGHQYRAS